MPDDRSTSFSAPRASDAEGRFEIPLNAASAGVTLSVAAPGYAFRFFRVEASSEPVLVNVDQTGGRLIVEVPSDEHDKWALSPSSCMAPGTPTSSAFLSGPENGSTGPRS